MNEEYIVLKWLPDNGKRVMCFGHKTYCCKEDMEEIPAWHEVIFEMEVSSYKLKKEMPVDPEESVLESYKVYECWNIGYEFMDAHVIGVTKWKHIDASTTGA